MEKLAEILGTKTEKLQELERVMVEKGFEPALEKVVQQNDELVERALGELGVASRNAEGVTTALMAKAAESDEQLYRFLGLDPENLDFHRIADTARDIATESEGWFLKKELGRQILREHEPVGLLHYLDHGTIREVLEKEDVVEIFSALRFTETDEWMHETFDKAYTKFTPADFEHRPIEIKVLGKQWEEVAKKYVAKKHHNVSHLKEFGVIFLNPIAQTERGKFVRDFALLLHYFHEIAFYSRLFEKYAGGSDFQQNFIALLRGDVKEASAVGPGEWLLVQRYLWKENPQDPRLFVPHVNPEAMHWRKAEQDLVAFGKQHEDIDLEFWDQYWSVGEFFPSFAEAAEGKDKKTLISFDLEDVAMTLVSRGQGNPPAGGEHFTYHQHEAMWNRLFAAYVGGYDKVEHYIMRGMEQGTISF